MVLINMDSETKVEIIKIFEEYGKKVAINIGCTILQEKYGLPKIICQKTVKRFIDKIR